MACVYIQRYEGNCVAGLLLHAYLGGGGVLNPRYLSSYISSLHQQSPGSGLGAPFGSETSLMLFVTAVQLHARLCEYLLCCAITVIPNSSSFHFLFYYYLFIFLLITIICCATLIFPTPHRRFLWYPVSMKVSSWSPWSPMFLQHTSVTPSRPGCHTAIGRVRKCYRCVL